MAIQVRVSNLQSLMIFTERVGWLAIDDILVANFDEQWPTFYYLSPMGGDDGHRGKNGTLAAWEPLASRRPHRTLCLSGRIFGCCTSSRFHRFAY